MRRHLCRNDMNDIPRRIAALPDEMRLLPGTLCTDIAVFI